MVGRTVCSPVALRVHAWVANGHMGEPVLCSHLRVRKRVGPTCAYSMIYNYIILCLCAYCCPSSNAKRPSAYYADIQTVIALVL